MSSFITRFLANMTMKESKTTQAAEARPRRHERSSRHHHHHHSSRRSSYLWDSDETETDDEPPSENSLMLDLGPDYSPKAMSSISFPSPPMRGSTLLFDAEGLDASPEHIEVHRASSTSSSRTSHSHSQTQRKPVQYYDNTAAQAEANFRQQRGRSSSRSSTGSQQREARRTSQAYSAGAQWIW